MILYVKVFLKNCTCFNFIGENRRTIYEKRLMELEITAFGIAKDILGSRIYRLEVSSSISVAQLKEQLYREFPQFQALKSLAIAINEEYAIDNQRIEPGDQVVLIPPVSGG